MCEPLTKKCKRSFVEAWLNDDRYKSWIRKVPSKDNFFHCTICNKDFSCNTRISRHADSVCHKNNIKSTSGEENSNENVKENISNPRKFRKQWLEMKEFQPWLHESDNEKMFFCSFCEQDYTAHLSHIYRHAESETHIIATRKNIEREKSDQKFADESLSSFDERKKVAEIRYAALAVEKNIPYKNVTDILAFFQLIGEGSEMLQSITMSRIKCQKIISNVLAPVETNRLVKIIQNSKFTIFIDETSDISNQKWMTFHVRFVDPETLDIRSQLLKLIDIDAKDSSAEKLFKAFKNEMDKLQISFLNIVGLSCDNASVMVGKYSSFSTKLREMNKNVLILSCPCHSAALIAHAACAKIPKYCEEFVKKIANYINSSPKRFAIFKEFTECFSQTNRKILKLAETRWLSRHSCIQRVLVSWNTIELFLREIVTNEKSQTGEHLLSIMQNLDVKAYLLFLEYILNYFNSFNAFFQALETRIQLLQPKSFEFLIMISKHFLKPEFLQNLNNNFDFSNKKNQKSLNEVHLGTECEKYLNELSIQEHIDVVANIRENCLQFYVIAAQEICKKLPINNKFLSKLKVFEAGTALRDNNRETSFNDISFIAETMDGFNCHELKKEWFDLHQNFTEVEKDNLVILDFDEMWKQIFQRHQYSNLKSLLNAVRSLPNSNADSERIFSFLPDLKTKKRNKLSHINVNASCVVKSALKSRKETAKTMQITEEHLSRMVTEILYSTCPKKQTSSLRLYAADIDETATPSSSNM